MSQKKKIYAHRSIFKYLLAQRIFFHSAILKKNSCHGSNFFHSFLYWSSRHGFKPGILELWAPQLLQNCWFSCPDNHTPQISNHPASKWFWIKDVHVHFETWYFKVNIYHVVIRYLSKPQLLSCTNDSFSGSVGLKAF